MESLSSLPTEKSVELDSHNQTIPPAPAIHNSNSLILSKIKAHLDFTQNEFLRNIDWQKQLIAQMNESSSTAPQRLKPDSNCVCLKLSAD